METVFKLHAASKGYSNEHWGSWWGAIPGGELVPPEEEFPIIDEFLAHKRRRVSSWFTYRRVFNGHVFNVLSNITEPPLRARLAQVTILRDPLRRLVSEWHYLKYGAKFGLLRRRRSGKQSARSTRARTLSGPILDIAGRRTFESCLHDESCTRSTNMRGWCSRMATYFCGNGPQCNTTYQSMSEAALQLAKKNIEKDFVTFGFIEDRETFLRLLELQLPAFFEGLKETDSRRIQDTDHLWNPANENKGMPYSFPDRPQDILRMREICKNDIAVYEHALQIYDQRLIDCKLERRGGRGAASG